MSKEQTRRTLVTAWLTATAEITIVENEEELCDSKQENQRKQELLDSALKALSPRVVLNRHGVQFPSRSPGLDLKQEIPETLLIKEEPEERSIKQEEEQSIKQEEEQSIKQEEEQSIKQEEEQSIKQEEEQQQKQEQQQVMKKQDADKPYVKKPPNAFMVYKKEQRETIMSEFNIRNSAEVNKIIGERWSRLSAEDQAPYFDKSRLAKREHEAKYPGWSANDNFGRSKRKKANTVTPTYSSPPAAPVQLATVVMILGVKKIN
ncbi:uncharacterized protein [Eucyclogobius newberryi]|uniref:uncharacterized protein n=1 Tax=Eucyclogobius newberryi TaxID=166745 RepID=UPI003B597448